MKHDLKIPALVCVTFTKSGDASHCSFIHWVPLLLEWFSIECPKTKIKVITLPKHKGSRAIHCPIKTQSNYLVQEVIIGFGWPSAAIQKQTKRKLLLTLK